MTRRPAPDRWLASHCHAAIACGLALACVGGAQAADTGTLGVAAVVPTKNNCKFNGPGALVLDFGTIDPASAANVTATATKTFTCNGASPMATFAIAANDGLYSTGAGARRMRHTSVLTEFMAYSITLSPTSATVPKGSVQTLTVNGVIQPFQFQNVAAGTYRDTVVISLDP